MNYRNDLPPIKLLRELFTYKDGKLFWRKDAKSGRMKAGDRAGSGRLPHYRTVGIDGKYYIEHRIIWRLHNPKKPMPFIVDHIDGDITNNRVENLRAATAEINQQNRRTRVKPNMRAGNKLLQYL